MDRIEKYRQILQSVVKRHAEFQPVNGQIKTYAVCDKEADEYFVVDVGWNEKGKRIHDIVLHFRLQNGTVFVERDATDAEVVRELIEDGVRQSDIVLAFNAAPFQKINDLLAA
jgi:hypothetical protein